MYFERINTEAYEQR